MKIKAEKIIAYKININDVDLGEFNQTGSWRTFIELTNSTGDIIIVAKANTGLILDLDAIFGVEKDEEFILVSASSSIFAKIKTEETRDEKDA